MASGSMKAMASGSTPDPERLDSIVPDPCPLRMPKTGTGAESLPEFLPLGHRPTMRTLRSALNNLVLGRLVVDVESIPEVPLNQEKCCQACIDRLCVMLLLPIGVVLHGRPCWVMTVRSASVMTCTVLWAACLYSAITRGSTGWERSSRWLHVSEATANLILLLLKACSVSFHEFNSHVKEAMQSQNMGPSPKSAIKRHILVIMACLTWWMIGHVAKVRLVAMSGGQMTWQVAVLPCLQWLYRAAWVLWLLRLNEFVNELVDAFCRSCASTPEGVDLAYIRWARISALVGQITRHCQTVYGVVCVTALTGGVAPIAEIFMPCSSSQSIDWMLPQLTASIAAFWLMAYVVASAAALTEKCKKAASFVNSLQACLPGQGRAEIRRLVGYMESSESGIFFGGSKLDLSLYSKLRYLTFSASVCLAVRFQTLPEKHKDQLAEQWGRFLHALAVWE
ncbi:unnamed protein product [Symbiodinium necroappetens]|uniref:Uncharacterized protein n=1 Tax=Symbiodinium necroappetens TaxID=1628268 RepID=A0A812NA30_9DINO|nr:unnamed protein product [Symbiodinium necroappetens]